MCWLFLVDNWVWDLHYQARNVMHMIVLNIAVNMNLEREHLDVNTTFLYVDLEEEIYMQ